MSDVLHFAEHRLQEIARAIMAVVYTVRLVWLFRFRAAGDRQPTTARPGGGPRAGELYSLATIAMPWAMESTRHHRGFYLQFTLFHLGVAANIGLSFSIPYAPYLLEHASIVYVLQALIGAAGVVGCVRLVRRVREPVVRTISTPDDYFSLALLTVWFLFGVVAAPNSTTLGEWPLLVYFALTAFFLIYVPFSKISHYLYYPFTRYWLGRTLGYRGVFPVQPGGDTRPAAATRPGGAFGAR